ncbi:hypothetical protein BKA70DRAFT_1445695 [Coprinopsis sp. MPI-PUGE-AT-0042]|nr:hypothetical protein BKA70DRAFT_1445695 [Coprinopsis sp. MPI-PUGE-AT-0042]
MLAMVNGGVNAVVNPSTPAGQEVVPIVAFPFTPPFPSPSTPLASRQGSSLGALPITPLSPTGSVATSVPATIPSPVATDVRVETVADNRDGTTDGATGFVFQLPSPSTVPEAGDVVARDLFAPVPSSSRTGPAADSRLTIILPATEPSSQGTHSAKPVTYAAGTVGGSSESHGVNQDTDGPPRRNKKRAAEDGEHGGRKSQRLA